MRASGGGGGSGGGGTGGTTAAAAWRWALEAGMGMYMAQALGRGVVVGSRAGMGERLAWATEAGLEAGVLGEGALGG